MFKDDCWEIQILEIDVDVAREADEKEWLPKNFAGCSRLVGNRYENFGEQYFYNNCEKDNKQENLSDTT